MEYVEGQALKGPLPPDLAMRYAGQIFLSNEVVNYSYDSVQRLVSAQTSAGCISRR